MLQRHRKELEDSLTFDDVKDKLYSKSVLSSNDITSIDELDSNCLKVSTCLDIILKKDDHRVLDNFIRSLGEIDVQIYNEIYAKLTDLMGQKRMKQEEGAQSIAKGGVPRIRQSYITRKEEKILEKLLSYQKLNEIIFLMGFPLVGKTILAARVLQNPELIFDYFNCKVFWLDLNYVKEDDTSSISDYLKRLIGTITDFDNSVDFQPEKSLNWYKDLLRSKFHSLCNGGLLVLDNVRSKKIIDHFDIGCKMLVIVNNRECVVDRTSQRIELGNFTETETAACFASALFMDVARLFERIPTLKKIHRCLEGHPELVALVATYLTESQADKWNKTRWEDTFARLQKDGDISARRDSQSGILQKPLTHITDMLFELLSKEQQRFFEQLVILPEHVNISPEVLSVYWGISDVYEVEDTLNRFHKLSLLERIVITNEIEENKFIYGLRNLFLKCLKSKLDNDFIVDCHHKMLKAYRDKYGDVAMLPNDNYIYNYYGYHLMGSNSPVEDYKVFLNLNFIGAKIKCCGVGAILQEFQKYRTHITQNDSLEWSKKLDAYINFVEKCETNLLRNGLDLVQYALRVTDNQQIVFKDAINIARNSTKLYLTWAFKNEPHFTRTLDVCNRFETVLFANDPKLILIGTKAGEIQLWDLESRLMILKYVGHNKGIKQLNLSPCKKYFLSVSHDMTFKIWKLDAKEIYHCRKVETEPLSPSLHQRGHYSFFPDESRLSPIGDSTIAKISTTSATFYKNGNAGEDNVLSIITCPSVGKLMQWTFEETDRIAPLKLPNELNVASNCLKTLTHSTLIVGGRLFLFVYSQADKKLFVVDPQLKDENKYVFIMDLPDSNSQDDDIQQILAVNDDLCVGIGESIHIIRFKYMSIKGHMTYKGHDNFELPLRGGALSCASLTEDGSYLVTGTVDGSIFLWDLQLQRVVKEFTTNNRLVIGLDTFTTPDSITLLLSGSDDSTVKCWHIASEHLSQHHTTLNNSTLVHRPTSGVLSEQLKPRQMFSCYWPSNYSTANNYRNDGPEADTPIVAVLDEDNNAIQIYSISQLHTDELLCSVDLPISDSDEGVNDNAVTLFQLDGKWLYYGLVSGAVRRYNLRTSNDELLWFCSADELGDRRITSLMCLGDNSILVGCNRNSLTLIKCMANISPTVSVLLNPSTLNAHVVRIFQLCQLNVRLRIVRLLVANSSYVYVLCTESSSSQIRGAADSLQVWLNSTYRMDTPHVGSYSGDVRITDCILSSTETHVVLFLSDGKCGVLRLEPDGTELSYVSEYEFQVDQSVRITASAISFDGQLLALGKENGHIEIIDVVKKTTRIVIKAHKIPIGTLLFSQKPNYILVSAAETICWWKIQEMDNTSVTNMNSFSIQHLGSNQVWSNKQPEVSHDPQLINAAGESSKYLLSRISIPGPLKHVTASKDFSSFITLDSLGIMHSFSVIA